MILNLFDDGFGVRERIVMPALAARIAEEEVWAQTLWPDGEPVLTEVIFRHLNEAEVIEMNKLVAAKLEEWRS